MNTLYKLCLTQE